MVVGEGEGRRLSDCRRETLGVRPVVGVVTAEGAGAAVGGQAGVVGAEEELPGAPGPRNHPRPAAPLSASLLWRPTPPRPAWEPLSCRR